MEGPVRVTAEAVVRSDIGGRYALDYRLEKGSRCYELESFTFAQSAKEALALAPKTVGWKGGYLFVLVECDGGNHWKCQTQEVFSIHSGELTPLGSLGGMDDARRAPGSCFHSGVFHDLDADLEGSDWASCHAGAPQVHLVLRDAGGRFAGDLQRSWERNHAVYEYYTKVWMGLRDSTSSFRVDGWRGDALFNIAAIAKYCGQQKEFDAVVAEARRVLPPKTVDGMLSDLRAVTSGGLPRRSASQCHPCRQDER